MVPWVVGPDLIRNGRGAHRPFADDARVIDAAEVPETSQVEGREIPVGAENLVTSRDTRIMIDKEVGEVRTLRLSPTTDAIVSWARSLPGHVRLPTGR